MKSKEILKRTKPAFLDSSYICSKCGMDWKGVMGYVCGDSKCPVQIKAT